MSFQLISRIKEIYELFGKIIFDYFMKSNETNSLTSNPDVNNEEEKDKNNNNKLCEISELNNNFFKYFCITVRN